MYGPKGGIMSQPIYKAGELCHHCPETTECQNEIYKGLCCVPGGCNKDSLRYDGSLIPGTVNDDDDPNN